MILEVAPLQVKPGQESEFEASFLQAQRIITAMAGYLSHDLQRCIERPSEYILLVVWQSLEDHEIGFRNSTEYRSWKQLLHHFYEPFPTVSHYRAVPGASSTNTYSGATAPGSPGIARTTSMQVDVSTVLDCAPEQAILHVRTPRLLEFVAHPLVKFEPIEPAVFPRTWTEGTYWVRLRIFGLIPFGRQAVVISYPPDPAGFRVRDNGHSKLIEAWDHNISISPESGRTRYRDTVTIRAGVLTPLIWLFAQIFYRHRQRRWRKLVQSEFRFGDA